MYNSQGPKKDTNQDLHFSTKTLGVSNMRWMYCLSACFIQDPRCWSFLGNCRLDLSATARDLLYLSFGKGRSTL